MILRELAAKYDLKFNDAGFKKADNAIGGTLDKLKKLGAAMGAIVAVRGVWKFIDEVRALGDELDKSTASLGISREALQEWHFAAGLGGVDAQAFTLSLRRLQRAAAESADGIATYKDEFDKMGVSVKDSEGKLKDVDTILMDMATGLGNLENDTQRVATSMILLGRTGPRLLPLFREGAEGIEKMRHEAHKLGGVMHDEIIDTSVELTDSLWRWDWAMRGIKDTIAIHLLHAVNWLAKGMFKATAGFHAMVKGTRRIEHALQLLGIAAVVFSAKFVPAILALLLPLAKVALVIAVVYLVFDDLMTLFEGGDSLIGRFIDSIWGPGSAAEAVDRLKEAGEGFSLAWKQEVIPTMESFGAWLHKISQQADSDMQIAGEAFSRLGDDLSGLKADLSVAEDAFLQLAQHFDTSMSMMIVSFGKFSDDWSIRWKAIKDDLSVGSEAISKFSTDWVNGFEAISGAIDELITWIGKIPGLGSITKRVKESVIGAIPGVGPAVRIVQEIIGETAAGPGGGSVALPAALQPGQGAVSLPPALQPGQGVAPIVPIGAGGGKGGSVVIQPKTEMNLNIQVPLGSTAKEVGEVVDKKIRRVMNEERRATLAAVRQRVE